MDQPNIKFSKKNQRLLGKIALSILLGYTAISYIIGYGHKISQFFALDGPTSSTGQENAAPILDALEKYKIDHGQYPLDIIELLYYDYLDSRPYPAKYYYYEYEVFPSKNDAQEFMLSFRARWSIGGWYCYYSEDGQWIKSYFTCWSEPRPEQTNR